MSLNHPLRHCLLGCTKGIQIREASEQLYELCNLAAMLRIDALAAKYLTQLSNTASDIVRQARQHGISLSALLGFSATNAVRHDHLPQGNTVEVIFQRIIRIPSRPGDWYTSSPRFWRPGWI